MSGFGFQTNEERQIGPFRCFTIGSVLCMEKSIIVDTRGKERALEWIGFLYGDNWLIKQLMPLAFMGLERISERFP